MSSAKNGWKAIEERKFYFEAIQLSSKRYEGL
jgi:hypothetical protein